MIGNCSYYCAEHHKDKAKMSWWKLQPFCPYTNLLVFVQWLFGLAHKLACTSTRQASSSLGRVNKGQIKHPPPPPPLETQQEFYFLKCRNVKSEQTHLNAVSALLQNMIHLLFWKLFGANLSTYFCSYCIMDCNWSILIILLNAELHRYALLIGNIPLCTY